MADSFYTYKQIPDDLIEVHWALNDYTVQIDKESTKKLPGWQKNGDIETVAELYFRPDEINTFIRPDRKVSFYLSYHSRSDKYGTSIHGLIEKKEYDGTEGIMTIGGIIPGTQIAGTITLSLRLCVESKIATEEELTQDDDLLASDIGAILFENEKNVILEGEQSYFPVADIDFAARDFDPGALYFLQRNHYTLDVDFGTAYRLYFNNKHPQFTKINEIKDSESKDYLLNMIVYDVYKQLIMDALDDEEFEMPPMDEIDPQSHTVRDVYARLIALLTKKYFDNMALDELRKMAHSDDSKVYNKFICALQSYLLTFGE